MKTRNLLMLALVAMPLFFLQSCLKDQEEVFDQPASVRLQNTLQTDKAILTGAKYGWRMEYYAGTSELDYGGYNYAMKFDDQKVYVVYERNIENTVESYYKLTTDNGPVLSFDTYNSSMAYFATPSSSKYEARGGDFEFTIMSASSDEIVLKGKRSGKTIRMYPLSEEPISYMEKIGAVVSDFRVSVISGTVGSTKVSGSLDLTYRQMTLYCGDDSTKVSVPFIFTLKGIKFYDSIEVGSSKLSYFDIDSAGVIKTDVASDLKGSLPPDYVDYADFAGSYTLAYWNHTGTANVTLTPGVKGETYIMSGLSSYYTVTLTYNKSRGRLEWLSQIVGTKGGYNIWLCAWDPELGYLSWNTDAGLETVWNQDKEKPVYSFVSNGFEQLPKASSFIFWLVDDNNQSGGQFTGSGWDPYNRDMIPFVETLTKK